METGGREGQKPPPAPSAVAHCQPAVSNYCYERNKHSDIILSVLRIRGIRVMGIAEWSMDMEGSSETCWLQREEGISSVPQTLKRKEDTVALRLALKN